MTPAPIPLQSLPSAARAAVARVVWFAGTGRASRNAAWLGHAPGTPAGLPTPQAALRALHRTGASELAALTSVHVCALFDDYEEVRADAGDGACSARWIVGATAAVTVLVHCTPLSASWAHVRLSVHGRGAFSACIDTARRQAIGALFHQFTATAAALAGSTEALWPALWTVARAHPGVGAAIDGALREAAVIGMAAPPPAHLAHRV